MHVLSYRVCNTGIDRRRDVWWPSPFIPDPQAVRSCTFQFFNLRGTHLSLLRPVGRTSPFDDVIVANSLACKLMLSCVSKLSWASVLLAVSTEGLGDV